MPQNQIPSNPEITQQRAAAGAGPVQVHTPNTQIPQHPGVVAQRVQAQPVDFFAQYALGEDAGEDSSEPPPVPTPPPSVDLVNVDDLLSGGQFPETPQAAQPQVPQAPQAPQAPQPQNFEAPPQAPQAPAQRAQENPEELQRAAIDYLRGNTYKFDDAMARQALTEPEVVMPMLAARLHVNLVQEFARQVQTVVPVLVERETQKRMAVVEAKNEFFRRFPRLNRPEWEGTIAESIAMAAQLHPGQSREKIMNEGAALAVYRIRSQAPRAAAPNRPQPFVPASPGSGGPAVPMNPSSGNPWADLAADPDLFNF